MKDTDLPTDFNATARLQQYEAVRAEIRSIIQGGYTLGVIGVALSVGVFAASQQFSHVLIAALPPIMLVMAAATGFQYSFVTYLSEVLLRLETEINRASDAPLLSWASRLSVGKVPWVGGESSAGSQIRSSCGRP